MHGCGRGADFFGCRFLRIFDPQQSFHPETDKCLRTRAFRSWLVDPFNESGLYNNTYIARLRADWTFFHAALSSRQPSSQDSKTREIVMRSCFLGSMVSVAFAATVSTAISVAVTRASAQAPTNSGAMMKTPWGEPDLQGIWTTEFDTPFQRPPRFADQEFFTEAQRHE